MKHDIRRIVALEIRDRGTHSIISRIMGERNGDDEIADPDIREMVRDHSEKSRARGRMVLDELDEARGAASNHSRHDVDGLSDEDLERVTIRLQTQSDGTQGGKDGSALVFTPEDEQKFSRYKHHQYVRRWGLFSTADGIDEEHIDFNALFTKRGLVGNIQPGPTRIALHALAKVLRNQHCSFCSLIRKKIAQDKLLPDEPIERFEGETIHLNVIDDGPACSLKLEVELESYVRGKANSRIILQKFAGATAEPLQGLRVCQEKADLDRLRGWLRACEETQSSPYEHQDSIMLVSLRVVDTVENRICEIDAHSRYACLSYVWGKGSQTQYTAATKSILEAPQGLMAESARLPQTILDAMEVTRQIGLRYLWIDALCILQDSQEDKAKVISQMHGIYSNATLTIVASTNAGPSDGLAGVGPVPRPQPQISEKLQGITVGVAFHDARKPHVEIENSVWNSRAWTFQERLVSRRLVYFTESQMTFACPHAATRFEDTVSVPNIGYRPTPINDQTKYTSRANDLLLHVWCDPTQAAYPNKAFVTDYGTVVWQAADPDNPDGVSAADPPIYQTGEAPSTSSTGVLQLEGHTLWDVYRQVVSDYTKRKMTWASDAVNAFTAIGELIRRGTNTKYWHGIPEFAFDQALLWLPREPLKRRKNGDVPLFPSWAWCAWEGHSSYRGRGFYNSLARPPVPVVKWLEPLDKEAEIERIRSGEGATPEQIEAAIRYINSNLLLSVRDPYALWHIYDRDEGWEHQRDEAKNEHFYTNAAYPHIRFSYPISLPGEEVSERPIDNSLLAFQARSAQVRFRDIITEGHVAEAFQHDYLQIGLNDEKRSANFRPTWQRIIYHQGYRAGFLSLNVPFEEIELDSDDSYHLVAMSRDSLPGIAPPTEGWDVYWQVEPRMLQYHLFREEWGGKPLEVPPPNTNVTPDTGPCSENGNPFWDTDRFGEVGKIDVYNVLLLRERGVPSRHERIGVGKMSFRAFHHAQPKVRYIIMD